MESIKELLLQWSKGGKTIKEVAEVARQNLRKKGLIKTQLLGWTHEKEIQRLIDIVAIRMSNTDFVFCIEKTEEMQKGRRGEERPTGRVVSRLTPEAQKIVVPTVEEIAKRRSIEGVESYFN